VTDDLASRCALLAEAWQWWAATLEAMDEPDWSRSTRLEGWDVAALVAHHGLLVGAFGYLASQPVDGPPATPSVRDMLRRFNAPDGVANTLAGGVAEMARQQAAAISHEEQVAKFLVEGPTVVSAIEDAGPIVVEYFGNGTFPIAEVVAIAIMEAVVHGLDLCDAIGADAEGMPAGPVGFTTALLASLPDPVAFIEAATGRDQAPVLPVLR
jgi:uncharacterized protein (TIGR03083 family)